MTNTKCAKHPKYDGKKLPKYNCIKCFNIYHLLHNSPRPVHKPTRTHRDKSKYYKKIKHKKSEDN